MSWGYRSNGYYWTNRTDVRGPVEISAGPPAPIVPLCIDTGDGSLSPSPPFISELFSFSRCERMFLGYCPIRSSASANTGNGHRMRWLGASGKDVLSGNFSQQTFLVPLMGRPASGYMWAISIDKYHSLHLKISVSRRFGNQEHLLHDEN